MNQKQQFVVTDEMITHFNLFRQNILGKEFKREDMKKEIEKKMGWKVWDGLFMALTSGVNPPIIRVKRGFYTVNSSPVYKQRLQTCFDSHREKNKKYQENRDNNSLESLIKDAITLLKNNGYKILKPKTEYVEV